MSVEEDNFSSHSINSIDNEDGKPNLAKIHKSIETRKSLRIQEKDLGIGVSDSNLNDSSTADLIVSKYTVKY